MNDFAGRCEAPREIGGEPAHQYWFVTDGGSVGSSSVLDSAASMAVSPGLGAWVAADALHPPNYVPSPAASRLFGPGVLMRRNPCRSRARKITSA